MNFMQHEKYMRRCLELAVRGCGHVAPNPMVGAVVVCDGKIIGEGYHRQYGKPHAEPNAIASVKDTSLLKRSTLYVNLEPCSHFGKTPPCSQLIVDKQIPRVVVGMQDPYPQVSGNGIRMMRQNGIEVITDVLKDECEALNKRFLTFYLRFRPYIILKWAQSSDGFMDRVREFGDGQQAARLSSDYTRMQVHKLRAEEAAIMVGTRTAILDNPSLTVRHWQGKHPLRIFIDKDLSVPATHHLLDGSTPTLVFTSLQKESTSCIEYYRLDFSGNILPQMMGCLYERKIQSLIVEGGAFLLNAFLEAGMWDEIHVETAGIPLGNGLKSPVLSVLPDHIYNCEKSIVSSYTNRNLPKIL